MAKNLDLDPDFDEPARATTQGQAWSAVGEPAGGARLLPNAATPARSRPPDQDYRPYAIDWRFLPEDLLLAKDFVRYHFVRAVNGAADWPGLRPLWANTLGRRTLEAIVSAQVLFIHIPKTGGTSISKLLYDRNLPHYTADFIARVFGPQISRIRSFAIVRHPTERLISAYKMALFGGTDIVAYSRYWRSRLRGLDSFEAFVDFVALSHAEGRTLPQELHDQASFILDAEGRAMVDRLFSLDARRGLSPELCRWLDIPAPPRLNATKPHPVVVTAEIQAKIEAIYRRDFTIYEHLVTQGGAADVRDLRFGAP